jgi:hypothetical protein
VDLRHVRSPSGWRGGDVRGLDKPGDIDTSGRSSAIVSAMSKTLPSVDRCRHFRLAAGQCFPRNYCAEQKTPESERVVA